MKPTHLFPLAASLAFAAVTVAPASASAQAQKLLLTAVAASPTPAEFAAIYNPGSTTVDLSNYYLSDSDLYYRITNSPAALSTADFVVRFPAGATIAPGQTIYVSIGGATCFQNACGTTGAFTGFGFAPDFELTNATAANNSATVPDMLVPFTGASGATHGLTNGGEPVILFYWDGTSPLVTDVDYVFFGTPTTGNPAVNKTGVMVGTATYSPDTADDATHRAPVAVPPSVYTATCRIDATEGAMLTSGGNGVGGRDETSEPTATTWGACAEPIPDTDSDGVRDPVDLCVSVADPGQADSDSDRVGDACDSCPTMAGPASNGGCPVVADAGTDAGEDAAVDAGEDVVLVDVPEPTDVFVDAGTDVPTIVDTGTDDGVVTDAGADEGVDTGVDTGTDTGEVDAGTDVAIVDAATDTGEMDVVTDSGAADASVDAARDATADARTDAARDVGAEGTEMPANCGCAIPGRSNDGAPLAPLAIGAVAVALVARRRRTRR